MAAVVGAREHQGVEFQLGDEPVERGRAALLLARRERHGWTFVRLRYRGFEVWITARYVA